MKANLKHLQQDTLLCPMEGPDVALFNNKELKQ